MSKLFDKISSSIPKWVKEKVDMQAEIIDLKFEIEKLKQDRFVCKCGMSKGSKCSRSECNEVH